MLQFKVKPRLCDPARKLSVFMCDVEYLQMQIKDLVIAIQNVLRTDMQGDYHVIADLISVCDQTLNDSSIEELLPVHHSGIGLLSPIDRRFYGGIIPATVVIIRSGIGYNGGEELGIFEDYGYGSTFAHGGVDDRSVLRGSACTIDTVNARNQFFNIYECIGQFIGIAGNMSVIDEHSDRISVVSDGSHRHCSAQPPRFRYFAVANRGRDSGLPALVSQSRRGEIRRHGYKSRRSRRGEGVSSEREDHHRSFSRDSMLHEDH